MNLFRDPNDPHVANHGADCNVSVMVRHYRLCVTLLRLGAAERELEIVSRKVARDHLHLLLSYRPDQGVSQMVH